MALGTVSCSGSSPRTAAIPSLSSGCVDCPYDQPSLAQAKAEFEKEAKADPKNKYPWYNLGVIAQGNGDTKTAQTDFLKAIAIDPKFQSALYLEGVLRYRAKDIPDAITYLSRAVKANPNDANAHWELGLALRHVDSPGASIKSLNELYEALKIDPALVKSGTGPDGLAP
ncbi:MAG: tetratricopeptide repeat protein [Acidimicrobiia bacterium]